MHHRQLVLTLAYALLVAVVSWTAGTAAVDSGTFPVSPSPPDAGYFIRLHGSLGGDAVAAAASTDQPATTRAARRQRVYDRLQAVTSHVTVPFIATLVSTFGVAAAADVEVFWIDTMVYVPAMVVRRAALSAYHAQHGVPDDTVDATGTTGSGGDGVVQWWLGQLRAHPQVKDVFPNRVVASVHVESVGETVSGADSVAWGVAKMRARQWHGADGRGVRVATIDTGVQWQHESLRQSYAGSPSDISPVDRTNATAPTNSTLSPHDYAWFDPLEFRRDPWWCPWYPDQCAPRECCLDEPFDVVGHGTHVTATIAGSAESGVGVAPGVQWMSAKGCRDGNCFFYGLTKSAQWVMCPSRVDGTDVNCALGADIVSNSWGSKVYNPNDDFYYKYIEVWREAGIIPIFSNGNSGPDCASVSAPGAFKTVFGVGATDSDDALARFSSRGPGPYEEPAAHLISPRRHSDAPFEQLTMMAARTKSSESMYARLKPDFVAPGVQILSASSKDVQGYRNMSGTSMATPHAAGLAALILSALQQREPDTFVSFERLYDIMQNSTVQDVPVPIGGGGSPIPWLPDLPWTRDQCDGSRWTAWPNLFYGHGRLDAVLAAAALGN